MPSSPYSLLSALDGVKDNAHPPIHLWHPENVKDIDMEIRRDGTWFYLGTPIERERLAWLFSTVLRREDDDDYYLVTPVEKCRIRVEDVPFQAILMDAEGEGKHQNLTFTTNMAERIPADARHPLRFEIDPASGAPSPYLLVRDRLEARLSRSVYYQLADLVVSEEMGGERWLGVWSHDVFFKLVRDEQAS